MGGREGERGEMEREREGGGAFFIYLPWPISFTERISVTYVCTHRNAPHHQLTECFSWQPRTLLKLAPQRLFRSGHRYMLTTRNQPPAMHRALIAYLRLPACSVYRQCMATFREFQVPAIASTISVSVSLATICLP